MALFDDDPDRKPVTHAIGQDLSDLSVDELAHRISLLESEIARLRNAVDDKSSTKTAAESLFRKG